jgi:hypothetical protein
VPISGTNRVSLGGKELDLTSTIPKDLVDHLEKTGIQGYIPLEPPSRGSKAPSAWGILAGVLARLQGVLDSWDDKVALRITIHELGSIDWGEPSMTVRVEYEYGRRPYPYL